MSINDHCVDSFKDIVKCDFSSIPEERLKELDQICESNNFPSEGEIDYEDQCAMDYFEDKGQFCDEEEREALFNELFVCAGDEDAQVRVRLIEGPKDSIEAGYVQLRNNYLKSMYRDALAQNASEEKSRSKRLKFENDELKAGFLPWLDVISEHVKPDDINIFMHILFCGNTSQAAERMQLPKSTVYSRVKSWRDKDKHYQKMYNTLKSLKRSSRRIMCKLPDSELGLESASENPETIRDVQDYKQSDDR